MPERYHRIVEVIDQIGSDVAVLNTLDPSNSNVPTRLSVLKCSIEKANTANAEIGGDSIFQNQIDVLATQLESFEKRFDIYVAGKKKFDEAVGRVRLELIENSSDEDGPKYG